jgi:hypothetical protein
MGVLFPLGMWINEESIASGEAGPEVMSVTTEA